MRLLVERGADRDIKDKDGQTAADWARKFNRGPSLAALGLKREPVSAAVAPASDSPGLSAGAAATNARRPPGAKQCQLL